MSAQPNATAPRAGFDAIAATYDGMRFVQVCATRLVELAGLRPGMRVLDVATGTGIAALLAARIVGPQGQVVGIDTSPDMLARATEKRSATGTANVEFRQGDAQQLDFRDASFDVVLCASSLFFVPDMAGAVREMRRVLAPSGVAGFTSFGPGFLRPLRERWAGRLQQYGLAAPWPPTHRLEDAAVCADLLREAGFARLEVRSEQLGYFLPDGKARWREIVAGMEGVPVRRLAPADRARVKAEHIAELDAQATRDGVWVDVAAHIAFGS